MEKIEAKKNRVINQASNMQKSTAADNLVAYFLQFENAQEQFATAAAANIDIETKQFPESLYKINILKLTNQDKNRIYQQKKSERDKYKNERKQTQTALKNATDWLKLTTENLEGGIKNYLGFIDNPALRIQLEAFKNLLSQYRQNIIGSLVFPELNELKINSFSHSHKRKNSFGKNILNKSGRPIRNTNNRRTNIAARKTQRFTIKKQNGSIRPVEHISLRDLRILLGKTLPPRQARRITPENEVEAEELTTLFNEENSSAVAAKPCNKKEGCSIMGGRRKTHKRRN
jgi:hypothetical protein